MLIHETKEAFLLEFPYMPHIIRGIKAYHGAYRYNYALKQWSFPIQYRSAVEELARKFGFQWANKITEQVIDEVPALPELNIDIPLKMPMYDFQKNGTAYQIEKKRTFVCDEMRLGKSIQTLATLVAQNPLPALIICPANLTENWRTEVIKWTGLKPLILQTSIQNTWSRYWEAEMSNVFIVNFESLKKYFVEKTVREQGKPLRLNHIHFKQTINLFKAIIIDESHRIKEGKNSTSKYAMGIAKGKEYIFCLTGTPILNKPKDLISQLHTMGRLQDFGGYSNFVKRYCAGTNQSSNLKELNYKLRTTCFYGRKRSEVLKSLPPKVRQIVYCEIDEKHREEYNNCEADLENYLMQFKGYTASQVSISMRGEVMVRIKKLKNIAARGKIEAVCEWITDFIESGEKLVIFCELHEIIQELKNRFPESLEYTGRNRMTRDTERVQFQEDQSKKLIIAGIKAGGVGIPLWKASTVCFIEMGWTAGIMNQCEDRIFYMDKKDNQNCIYFIAKNTYDEENYRIIEEKRMISETATTDIQETTEVNVLESILNLYLK